MYGVLGFPVKHSLSPVMFRAAFGSLNLNLKYEFCEVSESTGLNGLFSADSQYLGFSVTAPWKEKVLEFCQVDSEEAEIIGAANCVYKNANGEWEAANTDWFGCLQALKECFGEDLSGKRVLILGAGGVARAVLYACKKLRVENLWVANRTISKLVDLQKICEFRAVELFELPEVDIVLNCTSVGMSEGERLLNLAYLKTVREGVFDLIYKPTLLREEALRVGLKVANARRMLFWQATKQFKLFTQLEAPCKIMWDSIKNL